MIAPSTRRARELGSRATSMQTEIFAPRCTHGAGGSALHAEYRAGYSAFYAPREPQQVFEMSLVGADRECTGDAIPHGSLGAIVQSIRSRGSSGLSVHGWRRAS